MNDKVLPIKVEMYRLLLTNVSQYPVCYFNLLSSVTLLYGIQTYFDQKLEVIQATSAYPLRYN